MRAPIRYSERLDRLWLWLGPIAIVAGAVALVTGIAADIGPVAGLGLPLVILGLVGAITAFSIERYSAIEIDDLQLRAGRDRVELANIEQVLTSDQLADDVLARARSPFPSSGAGGRLLGGGWGLGTRLQPVGLVLADSDELVVIGSTDPDALLAHLRGYA